MVTCCYNLTSCGDVIFGQLLLLAYYYKKLTELLTIMQSVAMRRVAVQSTIRARPMMMARSFALSPYRLDEAPVKPDAAADSLKRGAKNVR